MAVAVAAAVLLASITLTYVCCVRPMRRSQRAVAQRLDRVSGEPGLRDQEIARLRVEVAELRARERTSARAPDDEH